jgi:hypothetical protein
MTVLRAYMDNDSDWGKFLKQGDVLFDYMIHNFDFMFDNGSIKHFIIWYGIRDLMSTCEDIEEEHGTEIQKELLPWILKEHEEGRLFDKANWKPFRDSDIMTTMYLGYNKMFQYKEYYFQLTLDDWCDKTLQCYYCQRGEYKNKTHFQLAMYGWKKEGTDKLQPDNRVSIPPDNIMPECYWKRK